MHKTENDINTIIFFSVVIETTTFELKKMTSTENTKHYRAKAFIFDLDGTLVNTNALVERFWHEFAMENGLDSEKVKFERFHKFIHHWAKVTFLKR